jgi:hypothetical protein
MFIEHLINDPFAGEADSCAGLPDLVKRSKIMIKKLFYLTLAVTLIVSLGAPAAVTAQSGGDLVQVIIQTSGSTEALITQIQSAGGAVNFRYQNVPAVAASIPVKLMGTVANLAGVTKVEKDRMIYLEGDPAYGKDTPASYTVDETEGVELQALSTPLDVSALPEGYANFIYTGAEAVWEETNFGDGTTVAVVDTGTVPNVCLSHAVIGAPGFPDGFNASGDGIAATDPRNHWHGTHVGGVIASACTLSLAPTHPLAQAIETYLPWSADDVPILGQAPLAQLYPVKVFPSSGAGVPSSVILVGLDHVLTLKKTGALDVDVVNMSLGGPTLFDGLDVFDRFIAELAKAKILVVAAAGNAGPVPNSLGSPATSYFAISAGALDYAASSRVLYEYLGLRTFGVAGQGLVMRPTDETRVTNFSSRGPLSDGRAGPQIAALGLWNFHVGPRNELRWAGGTSFSSPTVAGGAALLNAWWESEGKETSPLALGTALLSGANPNEVGPAWQAINAQGKGALDVAASLHKLQTAQLELPFPKFVGTLKANLLGAAVKNQAKSYTSNTLTLAPSETRDFVFEINKYTSKVTIEVFDIVAPDNSDYAYWPNALQFDVQSAKRTDSSRPIDSFLWYPQFYGDSFTIVIEDGPWTLDGDPLAYQPMEPGLMKVSFAGDYSNESPVSFKVRISRENFRIPLKSPVAQGAIEMGDSFVLPVNIPAGTTTATLDLDWLRKWDKFPTSDIDMAVYDPTGALVSLAGATGNAPERAVINNPAAGTWYVVVEGFEMYTPDYYKLYLTLK